MSDHANGCTTPHTAHLSRTALEAVPMADPLHPEYAGLPLLARLLRMRERGNMELPPLTPNELLMLMDVSVSVLALLSHDVTGKLLRSLMQQLALMPEGMIPEHRRVNNAIADFLIGGRGLMDQMRAAYNAALPHPYADPTTTAGRVWAEGVESGALQAYPTLCNCGSEELLKLMQEDVDEARAQMRKPTAGEG